MGWGVNRRVVQGFGAFLAISLALGLAPAAAAPPKPAPKTPTDTIKSVFGVIGSIFETYAACKENIEVGQPCLADDGSNIREALRMLTEIQTQMTANQNELLARFDDVDIQLNQQRVEGYLRELRSVGLNTRQAVGAWNEYLDCLAASSRGLSTCRVFVGDGAPESVAVEQGLDQNKSMFLYYAEQLPKDVGGTVEVYAGTGASDRYKLADALWILARQQLFLDAKVSNTTFRRSTYTPFVTPELAQTVNNFLEFYAGLYDAYGSVMQVKAEILRDDAKAEGNVAAAKRYDTEAKAVRYVIERRIRSTRDDSVNGMRAMYGLSPLEEGQIMMANRPGSESVTIFSGDSNSPGDRPMRDDDVNELAQAFKNFGTLSALREAQSDAFPKDDWYEVSAEVQSFTCNRRGTRKYEVSSLATKYRLPEKKAGPVLTAIVKMKPLDATPNAQDFQRLPIYCLGESPWGTDNLEIVPQKVAAANLVWAATFDWKEIPSNEGEIGNNPWGRGVFVETIQSDTSRIVTEQVGNKMVRWPLGFTPTKMPSSY